MSFKNLDKQKTPDQVIEGAAKVEPPVAPAPENTPDPKDPAKI